MKPTTSASCLITALAWLTAFAPSPAAQTPATATPNAADKAAATSPATFHPQIDYLFDATPLDRSNSKILSSYSDMLDKVTPAVVGVYPARRLRIPGENGIAQQFTRRFGYGNGPAPAEIKPDWTDTKGLNYRFAGVGSGCIISSDGYILTNHHVVTDETTNRQMDAVIVKLSDGRDYQARVVGSDELTDLAVLKVDAKNLPIIKMADSNKARVGDIVFAVGNPMDVGLTVTHGIISALGRSELNLIGDDASKQGFEDFIQTDAPINPGNSGGPLVDAEGRLIGLDSAIISNSRSSGGSIGIGFAIPTALVRHVADDLVKSGVVHRGFLGVASGAVNRDQAQSLGLASTHGALVSDVTENTPAAKAGLKSGDVVLRVNEDEVDSPGKLRYLVALAEPGTTVNVTVQRDGQPKTFKVLLADRNDVIPEEAIASTEQTPIPPPPQPQQRRRGGGYPPGGGYAPGGGFGQGNGPGAGTRGGAAPASTTGSGETLTGVAVTPLTPALSARLSLPKDISGLMVTDLARSSPFTYQFSIGTVIMEVNKKPVATIDDLKAQLKPGEINTFYVYTNGAKAYVTANLPAN